MAVGESALEGSVLVIGEDRVPRPSGAININDAGMSFGGGNRLAYFAVITAALTPAEVAAGTRSVQDFSVSGILAGDVILMNPPSNQANLFIEWYRVKEDGVVQIMYLNIDPGNITPTAQDYNFAVFRKAT